MRARDLPPDSYLAPTHNDEPPEYFEPGKVVLFPRRYRHPLPPDACPNDRERNVEIWPENGRWTLEEWDDGGGYLETFATKLGALKRAFEWVDSGDAVLTVRNRPVPERCP